ncbi:uncharacterized protein [Pyxicephalus adspersus]
MAPCWPGTALLTTKAPRKLVFLFTLSLSVTYLFYSLLSCYSSLQFPLQDAGIYLQPEPGISPLDAIRAASIKPDTNSPNPNRGPLIPASRGPQSSERELEVGARGVSASGSPSVPGEYTDSPFRQYNRQAASSGFRNSVTLLPSLRTKVPFPHDGSKSPDTNGLAASAVLGSSSSTLLGSRVSSTAQSISSLDRAPVPGIDQEIGTSDRAPLPFTDLNTLDGTPIQNIGISETGRSKEQVISTLDNHLSANSDLRIISPKEGINTLDSDPNLSTHQRTNTLDSATKTIDRGFKTLDSISIKGRDRGIGDSDRRFSTLDSSAIPSAHIVSIRTHQTTSTSNNSSIDQGISTPDFGGVSLYSNTIDQLSLQGLDNQQIYLTDGPTTRATTDSTASSNLDPSPKDSSTAGLVSHRVSDHSYQEAADASIDPVREQTRIPEVSSGENIRPWDYTGNEMHSPLHGVSSWDRTPLAATEMIPESHTGYLEREPQESSTTDDDLSRRISVNSTVEYGDKRLPQAIIIGVKKGGTRALLEALRAHPDVRAVGVEPHFFDRNYEKGLEWYRDLMPRTIEGQITMEKTPSYFVTNEAPQRIHSMAKDTKLIVVVRNPVTRAISDYTQTLSKKPEIPTFEVLAFKNRTLGLIDASWSALRIGIYALHLESWMQYFPLSQILFVSGERLITNPAEELAKVQDFLGLQRIITDKHFYFNKTKGFPCLKKPEDTGAPRCLGKSKGRTHPKIDPDVIQRLKKFYKPFNAMFYQMTGQDFQWEKEELEG